LIIADEKFNNLDVYKIVAFNHLDNSLM